MQISINCTEIIYVCCKYSPVEKSTRCLTTGVSNSHGFLKNQPEIRWRIATKPLVLGENPLEIVHFEG